MERIENLMRLRSVKGVGNATRKKLLDAFGSSEAIFGASARELEEHGGLAPELAQRILSSENFDPRPEMELAVKLGVDILAYDDPRYPAALLNSWDPPCLLYVRGRLAPSDAAAVGIVGTRRCTAYGRQQTLHFSAMLARAGYTIVSGLARGIDTCAHNGALNAGGRTIGVLGCGLDWIYPEENSDLATEMTANGALISEFPLGTQPAKETFPVRNRIIAAMSMGILVTEAPEKSGALITAKIANAMGRMVFALPGRITDPTSAGCNRLIRDGAAATLTVDDILGALSATGMQPAKEKNRRKTATAAADEDGTLFDGTQTARPPAPAPVAAPTPHLTPEQETVLASLTAEWCAADDIVARCGLAPGKVTAALTMLVLMHQADSAPGMLYRARH